MRALIEKVEAGQELGPEEIELAVAGLVDAEGAEDVDGAKAALLVALRRKGETAGEIAGFVQALLRRGVDPEIEPGSVPGPLLDVCGTGGDRMELFNVSTAVMFVAAAGGAAVVKHGNRAITSRSGGADVLEALGVRIELGPGELRECLRETGMGFIYAPAYHPAFKVLGPVRRGLAAQGQTTIFNILGPLLNPARPAHQLAGIFAEELLEKYAEVLRLLGRRHAWVVHGRCSETGGGLDELSTLGLNRVCALRDGKVTLESLDAGELGFKPARLEALRGGDGIENARTLEGLLAGRVTGGKRDAVVLNAAAAFVVCGLAGGMKEGVGRAEEALGSGAALERLERLRAYGRKGGL